MNRKERRIAEAQNAARGKKTAPQDLLLRAITLHQSGNLAEAEVIYKTLLADNPRHADALGMLGAIRLGQGNLPVALTLLKQSMEIDPLNSRTYHNYGYALDLQKKYDEALLYFDKAIALNPSGNAGSHLSRANFLNSLLRHEEALGSATRAVEINPHSAEAYRSLGFTLMRLRRYPEALISCDKALAINPHYAEAYSNKGSVYSLLNMPDEALASFDKAITLNPGCADAYFGKSVIKLLHGEFEEGWRLYEWRWKRNDATITNETSKPLWLGQESLAGKTIALHAEQGLGDTLQFCRYVKLVEALGAHVVLGVPSSLTEIVSTLKGNYRLLGEGTYNVSYDFQCPLMSLPLALGTTVNTIPADIPYLFADPEKQKIWKEKLGPKSLPRIGLVWSGAAGHLNDKNRSIALKDLAPLLGLNAEFHSLQKDVRDSDAAFLRESGIKLHAGDLGSFADTAALIAEMDLVISVDTSVAHLAGALGRKLWILLPFAPDFRWLLDRDDSPWYPTAKLFRQQKTGDWEYVIDRVKTELQQLSRT